MHTFALGHAACADWQEAARRCLAQIGDAPRANLGFLYVTDHFAGDLEAILSYLKDETGVEEWVGSVGIGICATGREYFDEPALAVMLATFPAQNFRVFSGIEHDLEELGPDCAQWAEHATASLAVVHADPSNSKTPLLVEALAQALPAGFLVGGITSSRHGHRQVANVVTHGGLSGVLFAAEQGVVTGLTQGCCLMGQKHQISEARGQVLARLDGRPALEVFNEEVGDILANDPQRAAGYIFAALPIHGSDTGDYLVRNIIGIDPEKNLLAVSDQLEVGEALQFCRRDVRTAQEDLLRMLRDVKRRCPKPPRGGVYYSCVGRGRNMFGERSEELLTIQQELGDFPLVGFFANGEISHDRLYGYTGVLTVFV